MFNTVYPYVITTSICKVVTVYDELEMVWMRDNRIVESLNGTLIIDSVTREDHENYLCVVWS